MTAPRESLERDGFAVVREVLDEAAIRELVRYMECATTGTSGSREGSLYAIRNLLQIDMVRDLAGDERLLRLVRMVLGSGCFPVRGIFFDKVPGANWKVPWHQDLVIAVAARKDAPGYGPWSVKAGVVHVQPPAAILERMMTVRVHLDDCGAANGPLRALPGSHRMGKLDADGIARARAAGSEITCCARRGDALLMRPLLLHASSAASTPGRRRVIHIEYAAVSLPGGIEWHERQAVSLARAGRDRSLE